MPQPRSRTRRLRPGKLQRFDRCVRNYHEDTEQFLGAYSNPNNATNPQRFSQFDDAVDRHLQKSVRCEHMFRDMSQQERSNPNVDEAMTNLYQDVDRFNRLLERWYARAEQHNIQMNPRNSGPLEVINLTGNSNSNSSRSSRSRQSRQSSQSRRN